MSEGKTFRAEGYGGIPRNCVGAKIRFYRGPKDQGTLAEVLSISAKNDRYHLELRAPRAVPQGAVGMWNFSELRLRGDWVEGRSFDDTLGVAILTYAFEQAVKMRSRVPFDLYLTRAEEVGYIGLLGSLKAGGPKLPETVLTVEMPRAGGELVPGDGVMLRAGDRNMNFDADLLLYFQQEAEAVGAKAAWFAAQRRLGLFGGTEVAVFALAGYRAGCLCLPVVHGHNIDLTRDGRPAPERVHRRDLLSLIALLEHLLKRSWNIEASKRKLEKAIFRRASGWMKQLSA